MKRSALVPLISLTALIAACEKAPPPVEKQPAPAVATTPAEPAVAPISTAGLLHPDAAKLAATGPDSFSVHVITSKGPFDLIVRRSWSPKGADRLYYLVSNGYYDGIRFFRVLEGFMAQFGAAGDPEIAKVWEPLRITDDPVRQSNTRGKLTFATGGPDTRTTQLFINFGNNGQLDQTGFSPIGEVTAGMSVVDSLYSGYGEGAPGGGGPDQGRIAREGNAYLNKDYPKLDYIKTARISQEWKKSK
jgi:peptidyl-prolyl cis-trans isomerase A (cyclophilin A)